MQDQAEERPNGPAAAALLAAGIGAFALGLMTTLAELSVPIKDFLDWSKNFGLGSGVGPLSGKVGVAVVAYVVSWMALGYLWRSQDVIFSRAFAATIVLLGIGFALTFPPIFRLFAPA